ncbi:MAG: DUF2892 domain-containing protein [Anaerolineae bacterium]|nr:DUF2892 domain-containing protein [Anaerolineae bacterium]
MLANFQEMFNQKQFRNVWPGLPQTETCNVGDTERLLSLVGGGLLALYLTRRSFGLITLLLAAGYFIYRGLTGYCPVYNSMQISTRPQSRLRFDDEYNEHPESTVNNPRDETVWESFPASDPPASW